MFAPKLPKLMARGGGGGGRTGRATLLALLPSLLRVAFASPDPDDVASHPDGMQQVAWHGHSCLLSLIHCTCGSHGV